MEMSWESTVVLTYLLTGLTMIIPLVVYRYLPQKVQLWCCVACNLYLGFLIIDTLWMMNSYACGSELTVMTIKRKIDILRGKYTVADAWCLFTSA